MIQVIPAINAATWEEVVQKIRTVEPHVEWVHIDVADGTFTPNSLWHDPLDLAALITRCNVEIHFMADRPEERISHWLVEPVKRFIVQHEVVGDLGFITRKCRDAKVEIGLAADSHTPASALAPFAVSVDLLQVLAVHAGRGGQEFERHNIEKIKYLRALFPDAIIEVDGGMTPPVAAECRAAGANIIAAGSYIFDHQDPEMAIRELRES